MEAWGRFSCFLSFYFLFSCYFPEAGGGSRGGSRGTVLLLPFSLLPFFLLHFLSHASNSRKGTRISRQTSEITKSPVLVTCISADSCLRKHTMTVEWGHVDHPVIIVGNNYLFDHIILIRNGRNGHFTAHPDAPGNDGDRAVFALGQGDR